MFEPPDRLYSPFAQKCGRGAAVRASPCSRGHQQPEGGFERRRFAYCCWTTGGAMWRGAVAETTCDVLATGAVVATLPVVIGAAVVA